MWILEHMNMNIIKQEMFWDFMIYILGEVVYYKKKF